MYEHFFGLTEKPFSIVPDPSFMYWGRTHRLAYAMLEYGVLNNAGISVVSGEIGCGKTTLIHRLLDQFSDTHTVALLSNIQPGRGDLLSWVLMGFGQPFSGKSNVELFALLQDFFISEYAAGRRVVIVIDEAQNLTTDMLEELRMLSNINAGKDQLLQLILVGQPELKDTLNQPELLQLAQRIGADFHLTPLNKEEVRSYIETRLSIAGAERRIFSDRAMDYIAEQSRGVPRVINIIADTALVYAFSAEELSIGVETVRSVVDDKKNFGVFGIASDDSAAAPLAPDADIGLGAFSEPKADVKASADQVSQEEVTDGPTDSDRDIDDTITADGVDGWPQQSAGRETIIEQVEAEQSPPDNEIKPIASPQPSPIASGALHQREEPSLTGVVIVSSGNNVSPEAAVRSAGDGRAVVFAAPEGHEEAIAIARRAGAVIAVSDVGGNGRMHNAGYRQLNKIAPHIKFVQFIGSAQALAPDWVQGAERFMRRRPEVGLVIGSAVANYSPTAHEDAWRAGNDKELSFVPGFAAFLRTEMFEEAGGFRGDLQAGEMMDLSVRLRRRGSRVWWSAGVMCIEPYEKRSVGSWWSSHFKRGYDRAFLAALHGGAPERLGLASTAITVFLAVFAPIGFLILAGAVFILAPRFAPSPNIIYPLAGVGVLAIALLLASMALSVIVESETRRAGVLGGLNRVFGALASFFGALRFWTGGAVKR